MTSSSITIKNLKMKKQSNIHYSISKFKFKTQIHKFNIKLQTWIPVETKSQLTDPNDWDLLNPICTFCRELVWEFIKPKWWKERHLGQGTVVKEDILKQTQESKNDFYWFRSKMVKWVGVIIRVFVLGGD
jgi:hypothetical protein